MDESRRRRIIALLIAGHQDFQIAFRVHRGAAAHSIITGIVRVFANALYESLQRSYDEKRQKVTGRLFDSPAKSGMRFVAAP